jgi:hypothetical protein
VWDQGDKTIWSVLIQPVVLFSVVDVDQDRACTHIDFCCLNPDKDPGRLKLQKNVKK